MVLKKKLFMTFVKDSKPNFIQYHFDRYRDYFGGMLQWGREIGFNKERTSGN